ncbi:MAG: SdrD B-like domain-containing protein [Pirellula sp.]
MAGLLNRLYDLLSGSHSNRDTDASKARNRRRLRMELLEGRQLMDANITGSVFHDTTENGIDGADPRLSGVGIALFRDGGNGTFDNGTGDDIASGTTTSAATTGLYSFSVNTAGIYYLVQTSVSSGLIQRSSQRVQTIVVTPSQISGSIFTTIDTFDTTAQDVESPSSGSPPAFSAVAAAEAIGGERDMFVDATSGTIAMQADTPSTTNFLAFDVGASSNGTRRLVYDGPDGDAQILDNDGLFVLGNGIDLTSAGQANGFRFAIGGEANTNLVITINSGANASSITVPIPTTSGASPSATLDVLFSSFTTSSGTGADFTDVGAITFEVTGPDAADAIIDNIGTFGPSVVTQNVANLTPMSIGNQVFSDRNNNGLFDTTAPTEVGVSGVTLQLFSDTNNNGAFNAGTDLPTLDSLNAAITTTTDSSGVYTFSNLLPGRYFVVIPSSQFGTGAPAAGFVVSSTVPGGLNNANKATNVVGTGVVTSLVSLNAGTAPTTDGDTNANSDLSFDIGLVPQFDLTVQKTTAQTIAATGATVTYTISARNDGPSPASGVTLSDDVPDGLRVISFVSSVNTDVITIPASAQDTTAANPNDITIDVGSLSASATTQRTYTMIAEVLTITTGTGAPAAIVNSVSIAGLGTETGQLVNNASVSLPVQLQNDLVTVKTITTNPASTGVPATAAPGSTLTYTVIARNDGPSRATGARIVDDLPDGIRVLTATSSDNTDTVTIPASAQDTTPANPDDLSVTVGDLLVGAGNQTTITITAVVLGTTSGLFTNTSTISSTDTSSNSDVLLTNNQSQIQANAVRTIDLAVNKSIVTNPASTTVPATAAPGSTFTYTILARNDGPFDATTVRVVDDLPDGIRVISAVSSDNTDVVTIPASAQDTTATNPDNLTIDVGNLAVGTGAQTTITIVGVVLNATLGGFSNVATISATDTAVNIETITNNNSSSIAANAARTVDLTVLKNGPTTAIAGNTITYTMTATNNGPSDAVSVQVSDDIPDGIRIISATLNSLPVTVPASASDTTAANPDNIVFAIGNLNAAASNSTLTIVAAILPGSTAALVNSAVISTTDTSSVETPTNNNSASVTTTLTSQNDVTVVKSGPTSIASGSQVTYSMNVTNNGPSTATSVNVADTLPAGLTFVSGTSVIGSTTAGTVASGANNTANVTIPTLAPGETAVVTILANVPATSTGSITNSVTVTATNDSVPTNNSSSVTTTLTLPVSANISGRLYIDSNNDGTGQSTEPGIVGISMTLNGTPTGSTTPITRTTTTDNNGNYEFMTVDSGSYTVTAAQPNDFNFRAANPGSTGGTAGTRQISALPLAGVNSTANNVGFTRVFSKRMFLASSTGV